MNRIPSSSVCLQTFISMKVNTPPGTHFPRAVSFGTRALVFVAALSKYFWGDSMHGFNISTEGIPSSPDIPRHRARQRGEDRVKVDTLHLHPKAAPFASETGSALRQRAAGSLLLCNNKNSTCSAQQGTEDWHSPPGPEGCDWISSELQRWSFPQHHSFWGWESHTDLPLSADQQKCSGSTLLQPPSPSSPGTAP